MIILFIRELALRVMRQLAMIRVMRHLAMIQPGFFFFASFAILCCRTPLLSAQDIAINTATMDKWSAPYRGWHYYPEHVIPTHPNIKGYKNFYNSDCPTIFQIPGDSRWYMSFILFNGKGYNSFVAESTDLVHWKNMHLAMGFGPEGEFDHGGCVIGAYLYKSYDIKAPRVLKNYKGKYWTLYGCYPRQGGYELRPGYEGVAASRNGLTWQRAKNSFILSVYDKDCGRWEKDCIYQPWLVEHDGSFYNFYNAANGGTEQLGLALSNDLLNWKRYKNNPVIRNRPGGYDERFASDGKIFRDGDHWTLFYFGVGHGGAHIMVAFSRDLKHWTPHPEPLYKAGGHPGGLDKKYAHKISLVYNPENKTFYMFYCAVGNKGRGIGLITSKSLGDETQTGAGAGAGVGADVGDGAKTGSSDNPHGKVKSQVKDHVWIAEHLVKHTYPLTAVRMLAECGGIRDGICIDIGCGPGHLEVELAKRSNFKIIGLDINPKLKPLFDKRIKKAGLQKRVSFVAADAQDLSFPDHYADVIFSRGTLVFIPDLKKCLKEVYRVLKPTGVAFLGGRYLYTPEKYKMPIEKLKEIVRESNIPGSEVIDWKGQWVKITGSKAPEAAHKFQAGPKMLAMRFISNYGITKGRCLLVCGNDGALQKAMQQGFVGMTDLDITALYPSKKIASQAEKRIRDAKLSDRIKCKVGKIGALPFDKYSFDLIAGVGPLIVFEKDKGNAMREIYRVLRKGGAALVGGKYLGMPAAFKISTDSLRKIASKTGIQTIRVFDSRGQWVEIRK